MPQSDYRKRAMPDRSTFVTFPLLGYQSNHHCPQGLEQLNRLNEGYCLH